MRAKQFTAIPYAVYLKSKHWHGLRKRVFRQCKKCLACGIDEDLEIHHIRYRRFEESNDDVIPLCRGCHQALHDRLNEMYPRASLASNVARTARIFPILFGKTMPRWHKHRKPRKTQPQKPPPQPAEARRGQRPVSAKEREMKAALDAFAIFRKIRRDVQTPQWEMVGKTARYRDDRMDAVIAHDRQS